LIERLADDVQEVASGAGRFVAHVDNKQCSLIVNPGCVGGVMTLSWSLIILSDW
jgi:hypothetical protein